MSPAWPIWDLALGGKQCSDTVPKAFLFLVLLRYEFIFGTALQVPVKSVKANPLDVKEELSVKWRRREALCRNHGHALVGVVRLVVLLALCHRALPRPLASGNSCTSPGTVLKLHAGAAQRKSSSRRLTKRKRICA